MYPHRIRLRGPWEVHVGNAHPRRMQMPARGEDLPAEAGVRLVRNFGTPNNLDDFERVWLTVSGLDTPASVRFGDADLGFMQTGSGEWDVTEHVRPRNQVEIALSEEASYGPLWEDVALEIRRHAYLAPLAFTKSATGGLHVVVRVLGHSTQALELYGIVDGQHAWYQTVDPFQEPLEHAFEIPAPIPARVRVDLIQVATIWYSWEVSPSLGD